MHVKPAFKAPGTKLESCICFVPSTAATLQLRKTRGGGTTHSCIGKLKYHKYYCSWYQPAAEEAEEADLTPEGRMKSSYNCLLAIMM